MIYLISGIDTGIGKTQAVAALGLALRQRSRASITAKLVQTGAVGISSDIIEHRRLMSDALSEDDLCGRTCPYVLEYPASPHLAARLAGTTISPRVIVDSLMHLQARFSTVLCEGAGGLMVPLVEGFTILDLAVQQRWPVVLVTGGRLGSLNITLLSLAALKQSGVELAGVIFNEFDGTDSVIRNESRRYLKNAYAGKPFLSLAVGTELRGDVDAVFAPNGRYRISFDSKVD